MTTLKLDLKILDKLLLLIVLFSCQTTIVDISSPGEFSGHLENSEYELLENNYTLPSEIEVSNKFYNPLYSIKEHSNLPLLSYYLKDIYVSPEYKVYTAMEYSTPLLTYRFTPAVAKPLPVVVKVEETAVKEPIIVKTLPEEPKVKVTNNSKPTVIDKAKVDLTVQIKEVAEKDSSSLDNVIFLEEMDVIVNKGFTIEMDQTGWLYEESIKNIHFENKFYTTDKVLFEFVPSKVGSYTISFVKYSNKSKDYCKVVVNALEELPNIVVTTDNFVIVPENIKETVSEKKKLEAQLLNIGNNKNGDEIYFKLAEIYFEEGLLKKSKEFYEYVYDNYPISIYYEEARKQMNYIINNFLKVR